MPFASFIFLPNHSRVFIHHICNIYVLWDVCFKWGSRRKGVIVRSNQADLTCENYGSH